VGGFAVHWVSSGFTCTTHYQGGELHDRYQAPAWRFLTEGEFRLCHVRSACYEWLEGPSKRSFNHLSMGLISTRALITLRAVPCAHVFFTPSKTRNGYDRVRRYFPYQPIHRLQPSSTVQCGVYVHRIDTSTSSVINMHLACKHVVEALVKIEQKTKA
jgi:hypothetical protein